MQQQQEVQPETGAAAQQDVPLARVSFDDFTDLTTRLVLMPRTEESEGAVVSAYDSSSNLVGCVLAAIEKEKVVVDVLQHDFSTILSAIREAPSPIVLYFREEGKPEIQRTKESDYVEEEKKSDAEDVDGLLTPSQSSQRETPEERSNDPPQRSDDASSKTVVDTSSDEKAGDGKRDSQKRSSWGMFTSRVRETSVHLADQAASSAAQVVRSVQAQHKPQQQQQLSSEQPDTAQSPRLFVQASSGALVSLGSAKKADQRQVLTNSSLILVRLSVTEPLQRGCSVQWYRSSSQSEQWTALEGATNPAFQPSATEVGHRLRCVVTFEFPDDGDASSMICETAESVSAAIPLFNGTRQALVRGAHFRGLLGRGSAQGRSFRLQILQVNNAAAATISQVSGDTPVVIHDDPLVGVSAVASYSNPKEFQLILPSSAENIMSGLLEKDNSLLLQAPNRLGRESILLAIGIANYTGNDLDASSVLYDTTQPPIVASAPSSAASFPLISPTSSPQQSPAPTESPKPPQTPPACTLPPLPFQRTQSLDTDTRRSHTTSDEELQLVQAKLVHKEKIVAQLQGKVAETEARWLQTKQRASALESDKKNLTASLRTATDRVEQLTEAAMQTQTKHEQEFSELQSVSLQQSNRIADLEKMVRSLQNEKAVLSAAVEARDSKLAKMQDLQVAYDEAAAQIAQHQNLRSELEHAEDRCKQLSLKVNSLEVSEQESRQQLHASETKVTKLLERLRAEESRIQSHQSELEVQQMKIQKLKAERNSYKQKGDSLAKEMARVCRNGRTIRQVEKILADDVTRREEVELLRDQKRKALQEFEHCRTSYEQSKAALKLAGMHEDSSKLLERNAELERLLSELTEYLNAKEMQLETLKAVNDALQAEIRELAKANMSKNDI